MRNGSPAHVDVVRANFAPVLHSKTMQLVQPVRDGLAIPSERQLERVVDPLLLVFVFTFSTACFAGLVGRRAGLGLLLEQLLLALPGGEGKAALDVRLRIAERGYEGS